MKNFTFYLIINILFVFTCVAQNINSRWGKVSEEELLMKACSFDPDADAMILSKTGVLGFEYSNDKGWSYTIEVINRIKIFNEAGKAQANVTMTVYDPAVGTNREEITSIKGITYNLEDGKIKKAKLENDMEFRTRLNDYRSEVSFAMPDVKEGSVIEYRFFLKSDYISNLYEWHFQEDLPVGIVSYRMTVPEFFIYSHNMVGNVINVNKDESTRNETINYTYWKNVAGAAPTQEKASMVSESFYTVMKANNIPAVKDEPMMNNKSSLPSRLESQLIATDFPNNGYQSVAQTYDDFSRTILGWSSFGGVISKRNSAKEMIEKISAIQDPIEKANTLYRRIQSEVIHNNVIGFTSSVSNKKLFEEGKGSVADINLTLIAILKEAGIQAHPVILSTRGNGVPHPVYPSYDDFNYVIAGVEFEDQIVLADASSSLPFGILPSKCLNNKGYLVKEQGSVWIDLKANAKEIYLVQSDIKLGEDNFLKRETHVRFDEYALYKQRGQYLKGEDEYEQAIMSGLDSDARVSVVDEEGLKIDIESDIDLSDDVVYINPFEYGAITENPFKRESRFSNVDFPYGTSRKVIVNLEIPEGYALEMPEATAVALPNGAGRFIYSAQKNGNRITILSNFQLKQTVFPSNEYAVLKQFYQIVADKNSEPIVLRKL